MPTHPTAADLSRQLADNVEAFCRRYLSNGYRSGRWWCVGDVHNTVGASMYVRLTGPSRGKGARGKWADGATGEHGDLLDVIRLQRSSDWKDAMAEARAFLSLPPPPETERARPIPEVRDTTEAARRMWRFGRSLTGSPAAAYLRSRGIDHALGLPALRFHPRCLYRPSRKHPGPDTWHPALLAAVTDLSGAVMGIGRTWLAADGRGKADLPKPRRALGNLLGHGVRFPGTVPDLLVAGEGVESVASVHRLMPTVQHVAALSAGNLGVLILPSDLRHLYIARDADEAGEWGATILRQRAEAAGILVSELIPREDDFNRDLCHLGPRDLALHLAPQLDRNDAVAHLRFDEAVAA
ncbi:DNA primase (plasmid) [Methylobacterium sp. DM1]|nr:DNA primase [Methylobacterium sp. DM1]